MSNLRAAATFLVLLTVIVLAIFQMQLRGYEKIARLNQFVLYETDVETCIDVTVVIESEETIIRCENAYVVTSGFQEYTILDALEEDLITISDIESYITLD